MLKAKILRVYRLPGDIRFTQIFLKSEEHGGAERLNSLIKARVEGSLKKRRLWVRIQLRVLLREKSLCGFFIAIQVTPSV